LDKFKEQVKKVDEELNKKTVELKNCDSNRAKSEKKLETVEKEIENLEKAMLKKNERKKTVEAEAKAIKEKEESLVAGVQEAKTKFEDMKGQSHEFEKEEKTLSKNKLSMENGLTDATNQLKGCQNFLRTHKDFQDKLELHDIPEEESEPLKQFTDCEIKTYSNTGLERKVKKYMDKIKSRPMPNLNILEEYRHKVRRFIKCFLMFIFSYN
jgi:chromosome segregation ATPase